MPWLTIKRTRGERREERLIERERAEMQSCPPLRFLSSVFWVTLRYSFIYFILSLTSHSQGLGLFISLRVMECTHCSPLEIKLHEMSIWNKLWKKRFKIQPKLQGKGRRSGGSEWDRGEGIGRNWGEMREECLEGGSKTSSDVSWAREEVETVKVS